jgi:hypothetical protein
LIHFFGPNQESGCRGIFAAETLKIEILDKNAMT